jgi:hypothetical protein
LVPVTEIADIADKFTRNEILTANEIRGFMGIEPHPDPKADQLVNSNMPQPEEPVDTTEQDAVVDDALGGLDNELTSILSEFGSTNGSSP